MNSHPYIICWIDPRFTPAFETYATLEEATAALRSFRKHYPNNRYFLYNRVEVDGDYE